MAGISAIAELTVFYSMLVSVNTLRHNPTIKTEAKQYDFYIKITIFHGAA